MQRASTTSARRLPFTISFGCTSVSRATISRVLLKIFVLHILTIQILSVYLFTLNTKKGTRTTIRRLLAPVLYVLVPLLSAHVERGRKEGGGFFISSPRDNSLSAYHCHIEYWMPMPMYGSKRPVLGVKPYPA